MPATMARSKSADESQAPSGEKTPASQASRTVRIGARGSPLSQAQAHTFGEALIAASGGRLAYSFHPFTTTGDKLTDRPLQDAGGKGLFTKELDLAQIEGAIDIAVHSLKDVTVRLPRELYIAAYLPREDARDCLLGAFASIAELPHGAVVGSSSVRRQAQLKTIRPDLNVVQFRGNVQTRLRKLEEGVADATLLAAAGLRRLGLIERAAALIPIDVMIPAAGQGIVAATLRVDAPDWLAEACAAIDNRPARLAALAERAFLRRLDGSCRTAMAAHFRLADDATATGATMLGEVLSDNGERRWRAELGHSGHVSDSDANWLGLEVAEGVIGARASDPDEP